MKQGQGHSVIKTKILILILIIIFYSARHFAHSCFSVYISKKVSARKPVNNINKLSFLYLIFLQQLSNRIFAFNNLYDHDPSIFNYIWLIHIWTKNADVNSNVFKRDGQTDRW